MRTLTIFRFRFVSLALVVVALSGGPAVNAKVVELQKEIGGTTVEYKVVLPDGFDADQAYPAVLVFGGGPQTMRAVDGALTRNFRVEAEKRGYIVIAPAAPRGDVFFRGGARIFPEFLNEVLADYNVRGGKFHVAGPSNGGIAAFYVAARAPGYFLSITAFPGYMWQPSDTKLEAISGICVFAYVGEHDEYRWHAEMRKEVEFLTSRGTLARYSEEEGEPHRLNTLAGERASRLFEGFEEAERGCLL
jgi:poly(3-hydroxybutyrate) depolymerase